MGYRSGVAANCDISHRGCSDLVLLWLWCRPAAVALIEPLAWEFPYASGTALKRKKKKRERLSSIRVVKGILAQNLQFFFFF